MSKKKKPPRQIAEVIISLECGGHIVTYLPCKSEKDLMKKLQKGLVDGVSHFPAFSVDEGAIMMATSKMITVH